MTTTLSVINDALKVDYHGTVIDQINTASPFWRRLQRHSDSVGGQSMQAVIDVNFRHPQRGIGPSAENATLRTAGDPGWDQAQIPLKFVYASYELTGQAIQAAHSNTVAFANALGGGLEQLGHALRREYNQMAWNDGSGAKTKITTTDPSFPGFPGTLTAGTAVKVDNALTLEVGMFVDIKTTLTGGTLVADSVEITDVDHVRSKVTFGSNVVFGAVASDLFIFREDSQGLCPMGVKGMVDGKDGNDALLFTTFQGIDRSTNSCWGSPVLSQS